MKQTYLKLKTPKLTFLILVIASLLFSCGSSISKQETNAEGFAIIEQELKNKFGDHAYYTDLSISYDESIGNMISVTVTEDPESLKMGQWVHSQDSWKQTSEITLEVPHGSKAADFMFQLNTKINLLRLGELVEKSSKQLKAEQHIENPVLSIAFVKFPKNGDFAKTEYEVMLKPETGGTSFSFYYTLDGELIKMDY